jgi:hypothetical protein
MAQREIEMILTRHLASYLAIPIFLVDTEGTLVFYNEPAETFLGRRFDETGEMPLAQWSIIFTPRDEQGNPIGSDGLPLVIALAERRPAHRRFFIHGLDQARRHIELTAFPLIGLEQAASGSGRAFLGGRRPVRRKSSRPMKVTLWGTRGSLASPGPETARYGGNTACVEVRSGGSSSGSDETLVVLDAGTGLRASVTRCPARCPASICCSPTCTWTTSWGWAFSPRSTTRTPRCICGDRPALHWT